MIYDKGHIIIKIKVAFNHPIEIAIELQNIHSRAWNKWCSYLDLFSVNSGLDILWALSINSATKGDSSSENFFDGTLSVLDGNLDFDFDASPFACSFLDTFTDFF